MRSFSEWLRLFYLPGSWAQLGIQHSPVLIQVTLKVPSFLDTELVVVFFVVCCLSYSCVVLLWEISQSYTLKKKKKRLAAFYQECFFLFSSEIHWEKGEAFLYWKGCRNHSLDTHLCVLWMTLWLPMCSVPLPSGSVGSRIHSSWGYGPFSLKSTDWARSSVLTHSSEHQQT